jgi:iron(III) transport system ATP-binding protein
MGIRVSNLIKAFDKTTIVHGISFDVADGEFVTLLGPSGCGKTTTLRCIAGLERTNGGIIEIDGQVVSQPEKDIFAPPHERNLGMVFQSYAIWPHMSVAENIAFPLVARGGSEADTKQAVLWALDIVGLTGMGDRQPSELSGGQQQRVALARAIVGKPKVLLFDEPLSNLDARLRDRTRAEISRIQKELAIPAVYVTHDQAEALSMSDRIIVMESGHIIEEGEPRKLYRRPNKQFTAEFIGAANFLTVTYKGQNWFAPDGSTLTLEESVTGHEGEERIAVLRSEHLDIQLPDGTASRDHVNALRGTIDHVQYMGPHIEYAISVQGVPMNVTHHKDFGTGTDIMVTFGPADIHLLPRPQ